MNLLDIRTIVFGNVITDVVCVCFVVLLWRQSRNRFAGTGLWVVDFIFQASALFLIVMRGTIPDWISMVLANTLVIAGAIMGFAGLERFVGKKGPQIHNYLLVAIFIFIHSYFAFVQPNLAARNLNLAVALLLVCLQCVWLLWHRVDSGLRSLTFGVGVVFLLYCLVSSVRIVHFFIAPHVDNNYFQPALFEALVLASYQVLFILLTYSFVLMVNKRLLMEIATQEEKFSKAFHSAPYAITITRPSDGKIVDVNETFGSITGYDCAEVMGKKTIDLHLWENDEDRTAAVDALSRTGGVHGMEMPFRKKNGERITGLFSAEIITVNGERNILSSISDITDRKQMEEALRESEKRYRELSIVDDLTQLYNSRHFYAQLKIELDRSNRYQQPLTLLLLDLDNFKHFNDAYGHVEGDHVLMRLGQVVKRCLRQTDSAYRYGGEEFTILLPMTTNADGAVTAERIRTEFKKETFSPVPGQDVHVTVSIGLAQYKPQEEMKAFVHRVDQLMYQGKKNGKDRVCSEPSPQEEFKLKVSSKHFFFLY
jgi:diguanylate cyclase (GGDEF)-like protein/PAS domain S-box-containing protein